MIEWYWLLGGGILALITSLLFEPVRDFIVDIFEDIFQDFWDGLIYIITLQWVGDIPEFFGSMFENIGEFSPFGLVFGLLSAGLIYMLREQMLTPFIKNMGGIEGIFWTIATYVVCFATGYFMGKHFENT